ncbi:MAG TPA: 3-phosphoshikimate 1-carboxyvinyltransferase [Candidatus Dormibacteraeota bacterium]|nr:3-phosphoshikimate 1-carboxyvinyltransferase [Candidatus Dormibacteraeota bacterium]
MAVCEGPVGPAGAVTTIEPAASVAGEVTVPGDKAISHRALILGALARGRSYVGNLSPAHDVASTAACLRACGGAVREFGRGRAVCDGEGPGVTLRTPSSTLDCANSGTTMRLLAGVVAGHGGMEAVLDGDVSLRRRPMERVAAPLRVAGRRPLAGGRVVLPVASAQVKSAALLAGLCGDAPVTVVEPAQTRDHTERMLRMCGVEVRAGEDGVSVRPGPLAPFGMRVPGDLSSAAFLLALAAARPGWSMACPGVTLNPGRIGVLEVLRAMGAGVEVEDADPAGGVEPVGTVRVRGGEGLHATVVAGDLVPRCIDEIPVLAVLATQAHGVTEIRDASELRAKESDRIACLVGGLRALGADVEERQDGLAVAGSGGSPLRAARLDAALDHRLAMAWAVAACLADGPCVVDGADAVSVSYPEFFSDLAAVACRA